MGKITSYPADASPSSDDLVLTVNDPGGSPANKKVTLSAVWAPAESASTRASSVQANVVVESSSRVAADNALDTKAESASTRASSAAVQAVTADSKAESAVTFANSQNTVQSTAIVTADSKAVSVELQFSYIATTTITSASTLSSEQIQGGFIMVSAAITVTLPAVVIGAVVTIYSTGANQVRVDPDNVDRMILDGSAKADGKYLQSASAAGDYITVIGDSADGWTVIGRSGTWTAEA